MCGVYVVYAITHLSVPNSCRSDVDVYWTNLSLARIVFRAFNETRSFAARLNQIPKYPKNFWRGESNRAGCEMQISTGIFSSISLFLSFFSLHCAKTWIKYPPFPKFFCYCFYSVEAWRFIAFLPPYEVRASCNHSNLTHDGFSRRHMDQESIYRVDVWLAGNPMLFVRLHPLILLFEPIQK